MQSIEQYFSPEAVEILRRLIAENGGHEIFCLATLDEALRAVTIRAVARGNENCVPAVLEAAEFGMVAIHNHPSGHLVPSENDVVLGGELGALGVGSYIVDNAVERLHVLVEPFRAREVQPLQEEALLALFTPAGSLAAAFPGYEWRPQQVQMIRHVCRVFNEHLVGLIEAGTGVGKSLAYLVPAVHWAVANKQKIVVSTNTINLQEQLIHKDLPALRQALGLDFTAVLMKGRSNYVCKRKARDLRRDASQLGAEDRLEEIRQLLEWIGQTRDGSRSDLNFVPESDTWELLCCEADSCNRARCPFFSECFFYQARRDAAKAHLIVTNHHLLMADLALKASGAGRTAGVLPAFHKLIIDEAHHIEDVATAYLGVEVTPWSFYRNLGRLQSHRADDKGLVPFLGQRIHNLQTEATQREATRIGKFIAGPFTDARRECRDRIESIFHDMVKNVLAQEEKSLAAGGEYKRRISSAVEDSPLWREAIRPAAAAVAEAGQEFVGVCQELLKKIYRLDQETLEKLQSPLLDLEAVVLRLRSLLDDLADYQKAGPEECRWLEIKRRRHAYHPALCRAPLDVADRLKDMVFNSYEAVLLTSATLAIGHSFDFIKGRTGLALLPPDRLLESILDSPFDYPGRVLLAIPTDLPDPGRREFPEALGKLVRDTVALTGGGAFVLFTAYGLLMEVWQALEEPLRLDGFTVLRQGQMNRHQLLQEFRERKQAVLFATDSFWEGVDVKGEALQCVILTKLPFQVPTEPLVEARLEKIQQDGGNPFRDYSVPHAVIKLKQGFGRLIRSHDDWGLVVIADGRVLTKFYGRQFLQSLPPCRQRAMAAPRLLEEMAHFRSRFVKGDSPQRHGGHGED